MENTLNLQEEKAYLERMQKIAIDPRLQDIEYVLCEKDPVYFLTNYAYTLDQHDALFPMKRFPDKEYVREYVRMWRENDLLLVLKSRQIMASWLSMGMLLWEVQFNKGRFCFAQSKKEDDADALVERAYQMYLQEPAWIRRKEAKYSYCTLRFPENSSMIKGIPQGGDQIRMHTASIIFMDEMAFQDEAERSLVAAKPTIDGGGKFVGISTAEPGFFQTLVDFQAPETELCQGMAVKQSPLGFAVVRLHYTADPDKRSPEWIEKAKKGTTPAGWAKEMEMDFGAFSGQLALPELEEFKKRIYIDPFPIPDYWPKYGAIDFGYRNPFAFYTYAIDSEGVIYVYSEHYQKERSLRWHSEKIKAHEDYHKLEYITIDPSTAAMTQQDASGGLRSIWEQLVELGVDNLTPGRRAEIAALERLRLLVNEDKIRIMKTCPNLMWELEHLRYQEMTAGQIEKKNAKERLVDKDNHGWDCLKYFIMSLPDPAKKEDETYDSIRWKQMKRQMQGIDPDENEPMDFERAEFERKDTQPIME